jgi:acyl carrier protein phosphodiesterase
MNFLAHLYLAGDDEGLIVGNLLGDFVKGRLQGDYPAAIERGIALHRRIDSFSGLNHHFLKSKKRIDLSFGHYRGVMVDLFYDHFLARNWGNFSDRELYRFLIGIRRVVEKKQGLLPDRLSRFIPYIFDELLPSYSEIEGIGRALGRMSARSVRQNRLGEGANELKIHYEGLLEDFHLFFPELCGFVREWKESNPR